MSKKIEGLAKILGYIDVAQLEASLESNIEFRRWWAVIGQLDLEIERRDQTIAILQMKLLDTKGRYDCCK